MPTNPTVKVDTPKPPPVEPPSKEAKVPGKAGTFAVHFGGIPAGAAVTVDGDSASACKSPCSLTLPKGRHTLTGVMDGFSSIARSFEVTGETNVAVELVEAMGFLVVNSTPPGATVSINGQERPDKTPARFRLKAGTYQLVVSHDGQRDSPSATVKDGATLTLNVNFQ